MGPKKASLASPSSSSSSRRYGYEPVSTLTFKELQSSDELTSFPLPLLYLIMDYTIHIRLVLTGRGQSCIWSCDLLRFIKRAIEALPPLVSSTNATSATIGMGRRPPVAAKKGPAKVSYQAKVAKAIAAGEPIPPPLWLSVPLMSSMMNPRNRMEWTCNNGLLTMWPANLRDHFHYQLSLTDLMDISFAPSLPSVATTSSMIAKSTITTATTTTETAARTAANMKWRRSEWIVPDINNNSESTPLVPSTVSTTIASTPTPSTAALPTYYRADCQTVALIPYWSAIPSANVATNNNGTSNDTAATSNGTDTKDFNAPMTTCVESQNTDNTDRPKNVTTTPIGGRYYDTIAHLFGGFTSPSMLRSHHIFDGHSSFTSEPKHRWIPFEADKDGMHGRADMMHAVDHKRHCIWLIGGWYWENGRRCRQRSFWCYHYLTMKWTILRDVPDEFTCYDAQMIVIDDDLYVMGGESYSTSNVRRYSIKHGKWTAHVPWSLPTNLKSFTCLLLPYQPCYTTNGSKNNTSTDATAGVSMDQDERILIIMGGMARVLLGRYFTYECTKDVWAIRVADMNINKWIALPSLPQAMADVSYHIVPL